MATDLQSRLPIRLGTRGSPLALAQAHMVRAALIAKHALAEDDVTLVIVKTTGDKVQDRPLAEIGGKALWTKELDRALLENEVDCCVHSMKDVETIRPDSIGIAAMLPRAPVQDRLIGAASIDALPHGARIGTSSPRRAAQLRHIRPDLVPVTFRGNVATRLAKLDAGEADATLLAAAGLLRLGEGAVGADISTDLMLPAPAQGAVGIECRSDDAMMHALLSGIADAPTMDCVLAERALLAGLGGNCHSPIAALATLKDQKLRIRAEIYSEAGEEKFADEAVIVRGDEVAARHFGESLIARAPAAIATLFGA